MASVPAHCNKIPFPEFSHYWAPCLFNTQYLQKAYLFKQLGKYENMLAFTDMFTATKSVHLCTRGLLSETNKLNCIWNIVIVIASTTPWLKHGICGADKSVHQPCPVFQVWLMLETRWHMFQVCQLYLIFLHWKTYPSTVHL